MWNKVIVHTVYRNNPKKAGLSPYELGKRARQLLLMLWRQLRDMLLIGAGIGSASFGLKRFLLPSSFIDGGATGIALLMAELFAFPLGFLLVLINLPSITQGRLSAIFSWALIS